MEIIYNHKLSELHVFFLFIQVKTAVIYGSTVSSKRLTGCLKLRVKQQTTELGPEKSELMYL